jgi:hypothetical protein
MRLTSDELKVFKKIACEHDAKILSALGFEINGNINIQSACPVHGGDNKTAFSYHLGKCCCHALPITVIRSTEMISLGFVVVLKR